MCNDLEVRIREFFQETWEIQPTTDQFRDLCALIQGFTPDPGGLKMKYFKSWLDPDAADPATYTSYGFTVSQEMTLQVHMEIPDQDIKSDCMYCLFEIPKPASFAAVRTFEKYLQSVKA